MIAEKETLDDCPICFEQITISHAVMCENNHKICGRCLVKLFGTR